jgi:collagen type I/II/III/V/XI/XXIV/XXVII alpha
VLDALNTYTGGTTLSGGTLELDVAGAAGGGGITFAGPANLQFAAALAIPTNEIRGFAANDTFIMPDIVQSVDYDGSNVLTVDYGSGLVAELDIGAGYGAAGSSGFRFSGEDVQLVCFAAGTPILTASGEVPVERLAAGDRVMTLQDGALAPATVEWVGYRTVDPVRHPHPDRVCPVRIRRHAFAPNVPHRDLLVSLDHAIFVDGVLIPAKFLINGDTVVQDMRRTAITYFHVELALHAVLLAAGLPTESYLNDGNRGWFANGGPVVIQHPDFSTRAWNAAGCAPMVVTGAALDNVRNRLARRAAMLKHKAMSSPRRRRA